MTSTIIKEMIDNFGYHIFNEYESFTYISSKNTYNNSAIDHKITFAMKNGEKYRISHTVEDTEIYFIFVIYKFNKYNKQYVKHFVLTKLKN